MPQNLKVSCFEFVVYEALKWYSEVSKKHMRENDFSILKSLKLLFFVSAANARSNSFSLLLEDTFNNYVAMPYGHVESDIYNHIRESKGELEFFKIDNLRTYIKRDDFDSLTQVIDEQVRIEVKSSIDNLKVSHRNLVLLPAFDLVNLSHAWYSWQYFYKLANQNHQKSCSINPQVIKRESKIYSF